MDVLFIGLIVGFFLLSAWLVGALDRL